MSENDILSMKISQLAGRINRHKSQQGSPSPVVQIGESSSAHTYHNHYGSSSRGAPYWIPSSRGGGSNYRGRGRGARMSQVSHRNKTLVLNNNSKNSGSSTPVTPGTSTPTEEAQQQQQQQNTHQSTGAAANAQNDVSMDPNTGNWIAKTDRHMQLINSSVYDKQAQARTKAIEKTRLEKIKRREEKERAHFKVFLQRPPGHPNGHGANIYNNTVLNSHHEIVIAGARYTVSNGGSKLIKVSDDSKKPTPKLAIVGGVKFIRSTTGNLWRSGYIQVQRNIKQRKIKIPCRFFSLTGTCQRGLSCLYTHDHDRVAICPKFLQSSCPDNDSCDLSHEPNSHRVPHCLHFQRGNCTNADCKYVHVKVSAAAKICRAFAKFGYCEKGADCTEKHSYECPEYDENGSCKDKMCKLRHVDHAGRRRMHAAAAAEASSSSKTDSNNNGPEATNMDDSKDIYSDDEEEQGLDSDDVDSDAFSDEELIPNPEGYNTEILNQDDYIGF